jgi:hypothetical protein
MFNYLSTADDMLDIVVIYASLSHPPLRMRENANNAGFINLSDTSDNRGIVRRVVEWDDSIHADTYPPMVSCTYRQHDLMA